MTTDKQFDKLNRLPEIQSDTGFQPVGFHCQYTTGNQRSRAELADGSQVPDQQFEYQFDDIGNRRETKEGGAAFQVASYTVNSLNQYDARTMPGAVDVNGLAEPDAAVQVNGQSAYRRGEYFQKAVTVANSDNPVYQEVNVTAGTASSSGHIFVPQTPEAFTYDADGNLVQDGRWKYTWDAENRLIGLEAPNTVPAAARRKIVYQYDWRGRRIGKQVRSIGGQPLNLVQSSNGGRLLEFTSQYAESWGSAKVMDGVTGGVGSSWCSAANPGPQSFVFAFAGGQKATLSQIAMHNYGEGYWDLYIARISYFITPNYGLTPFLTPFFECWNGIINEC